MFVMIHRPATSRSPFINTARCSVTISVVRAICPSGLLISASIVTSFVAMSPLYVATSAGFRGSSRLSSTMLPNSFARVLMVSGERRSGVTLVTMKRVTMPST